MKATEEFKCKGLMSVDLRPRLRRSRCASNRVEGCDSVCPMQSDEIRAGAVRQLGSEIDFSLLEKQVRMLVELAKRSPVVNGKLMDEIDDALASETEYVIVARQQMNVLLEAIGLQVFLLKERLFGKKN